jgi:hypothetical protein
MNAWVVIVLLVGSARADQVRGVRQLRSTMASRGERPTPAPRVFRSEVRLRDLRSVVEHRDVLELPEKPPEKSPWRPRVLPMPMGSMASGTGSKGVKLKIRF